MKLHLIRLIIAVFLVVNVGSAWTQTTNTEMNKVIVVLSNKRGEVANYIYKDISKGFRQLKFKAHVSIGSYKELKESLFKNYDVVVLVSERQVDQLDPVILPFVRKNAKNKQLVIVALLPRNSKGLKKQPAGIDAMSSPSTKKPAQRFVVNQVATEVMNRIKALRKKS